MTALSAPPRSRLWTPKHVVVTKSAAEHPHAVEVLRRVAAAGIDDVEFLRGNRITGLREEDERATYARAKATLAVVMSPPSKRRLQPIPPSADWRLDLAEGCPAHCQYCYLAGSLAGPPVTRVYADLDEILAGMDAFVGTGRVTSGTAERGHEGTTFEASCYTDPLGIEHLTGSLAATIAHVGTHDFPGPVQLRATTKFGGVAGLLDLPHGGRTRIRASVNSAAVAGRFEGGTDPVPVRLAGLAALARAGYPVGLTIAPIMPAGDWRAEYGALLDAASAELGDIPGLRSDGRVHHPPLHAREQAGARGVVPAYSAGDGPRAALTEVRQVRRGQVRVPGRVDDRAAHLVRDRPVRPPPRRPPPLLDLIHARVATNLHASRYESARKSPRSSAPLCSDSRATL